MRSDLIFIGATVVDGTGAAALRDHAVHLRSTNWAHNDTYRRHVQVHAAHMSLFVGQDRVPGKDIDLGRSREVAMRLR